MEHEETYLLMMDALDGELAEVQHAELDVHLQMCASCRREWQALLAVHVLLQQTPALSPAVDFAQRTLARIPNRRMRLGALAFIYGLLLLGGLLPIILIVVVATTWGPTLREPAVLSSVWQTISQAVQVLGTIIGALLAGLGELLLQQPALVGWLLVLLGIISVWGGVSRQLIFQTNSRQIS
jgi:anti-sigma factor RsiW